MKNERRKSDPGEAVKNAVSGYAVVVLGTVCFVLLLAILATVVRIMVGAGLGA